jgi:hypothetical protein
VVIIQYFGEISSRMSFQTFVNTITARCFALASLVYVNFLLPYPEKYAHQLFKI